MSESWSFAIEYISAPNACEISDGTELICIECEDFENPSEVLSQCMSAEEHSSKDYIELAALPGTFDSLADFWSAKASADAKAALDIEQAEEDEAWLNYIASATGEI